MSERAHIADLGKHAKRLGEHGRREIAAAEAVVFPTPISPDGTVRDPEFAAGVAEVWKALLSHIAD